MLKIEYIRNGTNRVIGSRTLDTESQITVARDSDGKIIGSANSKFNTTRDASGTLVSRNTADVGLLFRK